MALLFGQIPRRGFTLRSHPDRSLVGAIATPVPPTPDSSSLGGGFGQATRRSKGEERRQAWIRGKIQKQDNDIIDFLRVWVEVNTIAKDD